LVVNVDIFDEVCVILPDMLQVLENEAVVSQSKSAKVETTRIAREIKLIYRNISYYELDVEPLPDYSHGLFSAAIRVM